MRGIVITMVVAMLLALLPTISNAQSLPGTAGDLATACTEVDPREGMREPALVVMNGFCLGYLNGLITSNYLFQKMGRGEPFFCPPDGVTPGQARLVFLKYVNDHPEKLHADGVAMMMVALRLAFPCKAK